MNQKKSFLAIVGPTASGKTRLAIELAKRFNTEILSVDAMQVYKGLDIGTAKPTQEEQQSVQHYGIDIVSPLENFNASQYSDYAEKILIRYSKANTPIILCGGTGLYYRSLLEGFFEVPEADPDIRKHYQDKLEHDGIGSLHNELKEKDLQTAISIHPNDARRIIRALEIITQTQEKVSDLKKKQIKKPWIDKTLFIGLRWVKGKLNQRITERVHWMYNCGLINETKWLIDIGCGVDQTAFQALGYRECYAYLQNECTLEDAFELTARNTIQYAKRQMTWFRKQFPTHWIDLSSDNRIEEIVQQSLQVWENSGNNTVTK